MVKDWGVIDRQVDYWERMGLPHSVAKLQAEWERRQAIVRMHQQGMTYAEIAKLLGRSSPRIGQIVAASKGQTPPAWFHLTCYGQLYRLTRSKRSLQMIAALATG